MTDINNGGRAFPWCGDLNECPSINLGMSLRDYFAAKAMTGCLPGSMSAISPEEYAKWAYRMADAMLAARTKEPA